MHLLGWKESTIFPICIVYILIDLMEQIPLPNTNIQASVYYRIDFSFGGNLQSYNIFLYERKDDEQQNSRFKKEKILISVHINTRTTCVDKIPYS